RRGLWPSTSGCAFFTALKLTSDLSRLSHPVLLPPEGEEMKSMKTCVSAAIAVSAIAAIVPVVSAQDTTEASSAAAHSGSSTRAANMQLAKRVQTTLYKHKDLVSTDVHAVARSGKITLVGMAPDQAQIDLAGKLAASVPGVTSVKNNLT